MLTTSVDGMRSDGGRAVRLFVAYLMELPLGTWVEAARQRGVIPGMAPAEKALRAVVRELPDHREVFITKAAVLEALQRFESDEGRRLTRSHFATAHLRAATENAALAVLVRGQLSPADFSMLYAPFESAIQPTLLFGIVE